MLFNHFYARGDGVVLPVVDSIKFKSFFHGCATFQIAQLFGFCPFNPSAGLLFDLHE
jgi:hypothetical protein